MNDYGRPAPHRDTTRLHEPRRDPLGIITAALLLAATAAMLTPPIMWGGWWWLLLIPAVPTLAIGVTGLVLSLPESARDERGNRIA
ncbi:MAG: hypothetical protein L0G94_10190 [Brachybacterium sp.]|uniref:hypothetical protein n=1 Tax=Brachybacterium sp. TaxID=1891286 RepID=UPI00264A37EB|nr:hypothetical protein [Brachybacterium sp.]MDN5687023.1 hypothetical protein [Brachybacterium sp.]